jgi:hypothetical protein
MKRIHMPLVAFAIALLAPAGAAVAKGVAEATVCGANTCNEVTDDALLMPLAEGGPPVATNPRRGDFYKVLFGVQGDGVREQFRVLALPAQRMLRAPDGTWTQLSERGASALGRASRGLEPFPAADLPRDPPARVAGVFDPHAQADGGGVPWAALAAAGAAAAAGVLALLGLRRRRRASLRARASES